MRCWRIAVGLAALGGLLLGGTLAARAEDGSGLFVAEFAWTNQVNGDRSIDRRFTDTAPIAPLVLWTRVIGREQALETLRQESRLPIWHRWFVSCGAEVDFVKSSRPVDEIDLRIEGAGAIDGLAREVADRSFFDWHTWSEKDRVRGCRYTVKIVDNRARPIYCESLDGACEISIELKSQAGE